jgi:sterol desaturase/sphingolipid hydroxylase (fatty acid hydroxylase superfamily)
LESSANPPDPPTPPKKNRAQAKAQASPTIIFRKTHGQRAGQRSILHLGLTTPGHQHRNNPYQMESTAPVLAERIAEFLNPFGLGSGEFVAAYAALTAAKLLLDVIVLQLVKFLALPKLPSRENSKLKGLQELGNWDYTFLTINSTIEFVFSMHFLQLLINSPLLVRNVQDFGLLNTFPALFLMFAIDDLYYTPLHMFMHWRPVYAYVHKHHHRQNLPTRGYFDAGNEHPIEQFIGLGCLWATLHTVPLITGLHIVTLLLHFTIYAALAMLNHTEVDVSFNWFGFSYSVRAHEMHHRYYTCNYAQYFMWYDKLLGTYRPYTA